MKELIDELNDVLTEKKFGDNENKLVMDCFKILINFFGNQTDKLMEYIENIGKLNSFKFVTDVNNDDHFKSGIKMVDPVGLVIRDQTPYYFSENIFLVKLMIDMYWIQKVITYLVP